MSESGAQRGGASPVNVTNELAKERSRAAADRTLMAWIRTSLSLITFGFGIDKIVAAIERSRPAKGPPSIGVGIVSIGFISIGILALIAAVVEHRLILKRIAREHFVYPERRSIAGATAILIILMGALALAFILWG